MAKKIGKVSELAWFFGIVFTALGVSLTARSGFGVSMVVAPAYVLHLKASQVFPWFTFGVAEYCTQAILLIALCLIRRRIRLKYLLTFCTALFYGACLDLWRRFFGTDVCAAFSDRVLTGAAGILICSAAIALVFRTYMPQEAYEMFVKETAIQVKMNINKFKWLYDLTSLAVAILLMLLFFHRFSFQIIGAGTLLMTLVNAPLIALFGKLFDYKFAFTPAFEKLQDKIG